MHASLRCGELIGRLSALASDSWMVPVPFKKILHNAVANIVMIEFVHVSDRASRALFSPFFTCPEM